MGNNEMKPLASQEFQIIFEKLSEAKKEHQNLFTDENNVSSLAESIKEIKEIVESYSTAQNFTTFTRV